MIKQDESHPLETTTSAPAPASADRKRSAFLLVLSGAQPGELRRLTPGQELVLGRQEGVELLIDDAGISRRHASICVQGDTAVLRDLGSHNGTWVDGERIAERSLCNGDRVQLGFGTMLQFTIADDLQAEAQQRLLEAALREPLTGLPNRRHFQERLDAELVSAARHARTLALLVIDLDDFKRVNDRHGHVAGDAVLRAVARALEGALAGRGLLARYGGDEFVVLTESDLPGARTLAEELRRAVEAASAPQAEGLIITASIGVAALARPAAEQPHQDASTLFEAADRALFGAKRAGRNVVSISS